MPEQILVCIGVDSSAPILMETRFKFNEFCDTFSETTESRFGMCRNEENEPLHIVIAIGKDFE